MYREAVAVSSELRDHWLLPRALAGLAGAATLAADYERASRLFGAVEAMREVSGTRDFPSWRAINERDVLAVHPRDDPRTPETGVFSTRSQDRPNPIGLHRVTIAAIDGHRVLARGLEAVDGTPVVDLKPVLAGGR